MAQKIKKGDTVKIMSGKDKGKQEKVARCFPQALKILVENVNKVKRHTKPTQEHKGGIMERFLPISISKVMLVCPSCNKTVRVGFRLRKDGVKVRYCKKCQEDIDKK